MLFGSGIRALILKAKAGDQDAFGRAFESFSAQLESFIRRELCLPLARHVEAMEVLDITFLRASRCIGQLRGDDERAFLAWLRAIATNVMRDEARRLRVQEKVEAGRLSLPSSSASSAALLSYLKASGPTPSESLTRKERLGRLRWALRTLKENHRNVIVLVWLRGLPIKEVARLLGKTPDATSQLLYRALLKLKEAFGATSSFQLPRDKDLEEKTED